MLGAADIDEQSLARTPASESRLSLKEEERKMSGLVTLHEPHPVWRAPAPPLLDEVRWQAWIEKGRARERRGSAMRLTAVKVVAVTTLIVVAAVWSNPTPFDIVLRFIVVVAAIVMTFHELVARHYALAAAFCGIVLLYNPVAPLFTFSGGWQRAVLVATAVPFIVAMAWQPARPNERSI